MRISVYKDNLAAGRGADIAVKNFAAAMTARGHEVNLFDYAGFAAGVERAADVMVVAGSNELVEIAEQFPGEFPWPVVMQLHINPKALFKRAFLKPKKWLFNRKLRAAISRLDVMQVLLPDYKELLADVLRTRGVRKLPRIAVIGNAVALTKIDASKVTYKPRIVYPGAIQLDLKRQDMLVEGFSQVERDFPGWSLHLCGKGKPSDIRKLSRLIDRKGLGAKVVLEGYIDLSTVYEECAFVAFTSAYEGFPLTILEAAAFAKTTVTCTPYMSGLIEHEKNGLIVGEDPGSLASALRKLMKDSELVVRLGTAAQTNAVTMFAPDVIYTEWENLLESVCSDNK